MNKKIFKIQNLFIALLTVSFFVACEKDEANPIHEDSTDTAPTSLKAKKIDVCHYDEDNGTWHIINISENAWQAHAAHGDVRLDDQDDDGYVPDNECSFGDMGDCNDNDNTINPGAEEDCEDGIDNDCDGDVDEEDTDCVNDSDGDGIPDDIDNCPDVPNPNQKDTYGSSDGDACEDTDGDGTPDVNEAHFCLSIDGVLLISQGTAVCESYASTGSEPNVALANGDQAKAYAASNSVSEWPGNNIRVTAIGDYAYAAGGSNPLWGYDGDLTVTANGPGTYATALPSSNTISIANSTDLFNRASSQANYCKDCSSTANGNGANTAAGNGTNNHAEGNGVGAYAWARLGNNNTANATGDGARATAHWGSDNTATSTGVNTCAGGSGPTSQQSNVTAVDEDKCN